MMVIAHRGACKSALENSWQAFFGAVACGAQRIELDLQLSADGVVFVMHDDDLLRVANVPGKIAAMTAVELRSVVLCNGEAIPELSALLAQLKPVIELNLELKAGGDRLVHQVGTLCLQHHARGKRVIVSSFDLEQLAIFRQHYPTIDTAMLWEGSNRTDMLRGQQHYAFRIVHPDAVAVDNDLMAELRHRGCEVYPWTPLVGVEDDRSKREQLWAALHASGVDGLCTNYPCEFKVWLAAHKKR